MPTNLPPEDRRTRAKIAAYAKHAQHDPLPTCRKASRAHRDSFLKKVDPEGRLHPAERARRAEMAFKEHMTRLAYLSARARRKGGSG